MKKILCPTDFSEAANNAFVHALEWANKVKGELVLLHTFEFPIVENQYFPGNYQVLFDSIELSNFDMFKEEIPKLRAIAETRNLDHIKLSHRLMDGDLIQNIKTTIKEDAIDLVVMGTSGATGWKEVFLGTNTGEALTTLTVPVLSIPEGVSFEKIATMSFTTRFREKDKIAIQEVLSIAKKMKATVKCLHVKNNDSDVSEATVDDWRKEFKAEPIQFFVIPDEDVATTISDFIDNEGIDVLVMTLHKSNFFMELFTTHLAEKMSYNSSTPILVLHE